MCNLKHLCGLNSCCNLFPLIGRTYIGAVQGRRGGGRGGRGRGAGVKMSTITRQRRQVQKQQGNPFLVASTSNQSQDNNSQNPFLGGGGSGKIVVPTTVASSSSQPTSHINMSQLAPPISAQQSSINPFLANRPVASATSSSQPPSYASVVSAGPTATQSAIRPPPGGPVPTFITHGPSSVQVSSTEGNSNQFIGDQSSLQSSQPPGSTATGNGFIRQPMFQIPVNVTVPQFPSHTQSESFESSSTAPPPPFQPPSYDQVTLLPTYQPAMQMKMSAATAVSLSGGPGAVPLNMTLHVKGVPVELNNQAFMEKHFSKFGSLKAVECHPQKRYATVTFQNKVIQSQYNYL